MFSTFTKEWNIYSRHFTHKRSEYSRHILSPQDWKCSVDLQLLSFSCFVLRFVWRITHCILFAVHSNLFSIFGLDSGITKAVPRSKFIFNWTIRPNPFTSQRMTSGIISVLLRSQPKFEEFCLWWSIPFFIHHILFAFTRAVSSI